MSYAQFGYSSPSNYQTNSQQVSINVMYFNTTNPITINENIKTIAACGAYFEIEITLRKQRNNRYETK